MIFPDTLVQLCCCEENVSQIWFDMLPSMCIFSIEARKHTKRSEVSLFWIYNRKWTKIKAPLPNVLIYTTKIKKKECTINQSKYKQKWSSFHSSVLHHSTPQHNRSIATGSGVNSIPRHSRMKSFYSLFDEIFSALLNNQIYEW
jgi:hypothetical protein